VVTPGLKEEPRLSCKLLSSQADRDARAGVFVGDSVRDAARMAGVAANASVLGMLAGLNAKKQSSIALWALSLF